ncbi:hypothetical protein G2W53_044525 [Senna tora]|uniref:DUF659 domain-containing protein n=1 Tax=Senna tora TaxID=362788 RepID=A0A834SDL7_9FABA|nr:hypothetical protein G2W53_044525 [Senna tora]
MATSEQQPTASTPSTQSVRSRADPAWEYCIEMTDPNGKKIWKCILLSAYDRCYASIGSGYKGPTYQALRTNVLHDMKKEVTLLVEACRSSWSESGCTIMADGDIGKMGLVSSLAKRASMITKFVYNHAYLLAWLRKRDGWTEIIRPGPTRFATTFIALKSIHEHKHDLQALVTSKTFTESRYSRDQKAKEVIAIVLDNKFLE